MRHRHLVLIDRALSERQVGSTTIGGQIEQTKRAHVKVKSVSTLKEARRACARNAAKEPDSNDSNPKWETISVLFDGLSSRDPTMVTILQTELCVDVDSSEYQKGRAFRRIRRTMDCLRQSVLPPDDDVAHRGVYVYACDYGRLPGLQQFFCPLTRVSNGDAIRVDEVPVFFSVNRTGPKTPGSDGSDWDIEWGSHCWYKPRKSQRKHAQRHLFKDVTQLTFTLDVGSVNAPTLTANAPAPPLQPGTGLASVRDAMLTGHAFPVYAQFPKSNANRRILGYTQYTQLWSLFEPPVSDHYGTTGQWIQAGDSSDGAPWGSIEGGFFAAAKYGGVRYHVAASTHRYNNRSDTLGGYGFYEQGLPLQYLARVILSPRLLLPPYGMCFTDKSEGALFGAGWIALPLFDFESANVDKDPLTWTFYAHATNFNGPVCCYPPQFFERRVQSWADLRRAEDSSLTESYLTHDPATSLAFNGPVEGTQDWSIGGEIPNIGGAFVEGEEGAFTWKVPRIRIPKKGSTWACDARFYTESNYAAIKQSIEGATSATPTLRSVQAVLKGTYHIDIGTKIVVTPGVKEIDDVLDIDAKVTAANGAFVVGGLDAGKTLGRYFTQTPNVKDRITNGTGEAVDRLLSKRLAKTPKDRAIANAEFKARDEDAPVTFANRTLEEYVERVSKHTGGIKTVTLRDGTKVRYGLVRFIEQPAIASLAKDFPDDFTPAKLDLLQKRFERIAATQLERSSRSLALVTIDPAMLITPLRGHVPVAVGSVPARGGGRATQMYDATW